MAYCTQNDLLTLIPQQELAELTADSGDTPDSQVVAEAIQRADAEIDSYLGMRYGPPLTAVPDQVKGLSMDIALYHLYSRRSVAPTVRLQKYTAAVAFLKLVAAGEAMLEEAGDPASGGDQVQAGVEFSSATRIFSRDTQGNW
jgi:phage gp36-like protein